MERIFEHDTRFIKLSLVENAQDACEEDKKHILQVHLSGVTEKELGMEIYIRDIGITVEFPNDTQARDRINIKGKTYHEITHIVAKRRLEEYGTLGAAAKSLGIDARTLKRYVDNGGGLSPGT